MVKRLFILSALGLVASAGLIAPGCGGGDDDDGTPAPARVPASEVTVNLKNWAMEPSTRTLAAGTVKFVATHGDEHGAMDTANEGGATHQLLVARLPAGASAGRSKYGEPVLDLTDIKPGETLTGEAKLEPGTYELACLIAEKVGGGIVNHYTKGMYTTVTVK